MRLPQPRLHREGAGGRKRGAEAALLLAARQCARPPKLLRFAWAAPALFYVESSVGTLARVIQSDWLTAHCLIPSARAAQAVAKSSAEDFATVAASRSPPACTHQPRRQWPACILRPPCAARDLPLGPADVAVLRARATFAGCSTLLEPRQRSSVTRLRAGYMHRRSVSTTKSWLGGREGVRSDRCAGTWRGLRDAQPPPVSPPKRTATHQVYTRVWVTQNPSLIGRPVAWRARRRPEKPRRLANGRCGPKFSAPAGSVCIGSRSFRFSHVNAWPQ